MTHQTYSAETQLALTFFGLFVLSYYI